MQAAVFVGPSLDPEVARRTFPCEVLPPIKRADIDSLLARADPPRMLGIIDGQFLDTLAISPKEVIRAIDQDVLVFGSSSMGALRAVECEAFGMVGVGTIFELYRSGLVDADDEVAIKFDLETLKPLSEPLVNVRVAMQQGKVSAKTAQTLLAVGKRLYFPERTYPRMLAELKRQVSAAEHAALAEFLVGDAPDAKREDALALLHQMAKASRTSTCGGGAAEGASVTGGFS